MTGPYRTAADMPEPEPEPAPVVCKGCIWCGGGYVHSDWLCKHPSQATTKLHPTHRAISRTYCDHANKDNSCQHHRLSWWRRLFS
jgi:hypothetical protein